MAMEIGSRKRKSLDAATEVFSPERAREVLRKRFQAELAAVHRLVKKAAAVPVPRSEDPPSKKIKASPPHVIKRNKVTWGERELLKDDLARLASELPDHIMQLLEKQSRAIRGGEMEIDIDAVKDEAILELRKQLDEFVRDQEQQGGKMMAEEEEEDVDIVGGVSPLAIVSAPLPLAEEEDEEYYVDICGDGSPVAMLKNLGHDAICSGSPTSSSSDSDSDSDSDSAGDSSDSDSDSDESVDSPAPAEHAATPPRNELVARAKDKESLERLRKEARCRAREKARQEVLETERTAMPTETLHHTVIKSLDIHQYGVGPYSLFRQLGLSLKVEEYGIEEQQPRHSFEEDLEEGEIRF